MQKSKTALAKKKMISRKLIITLATLSVSISNTTFAVPSRADEGNRTLPGLSCKIDPLKKPELKKLNWTPQEHWISQCNSTIFRDRQLLYQAINLCNIIDKNLSFLIFYFECS